MSEQPAPEAVPRPALEPTLFLVKEAWPILVGRRRLPWWP
jgi:hypothetical protein